MLGDLALTDSWEAHLLATALAPLLTARSQPEEREAAVEEAMAMVQEWRSCIAPAMTASLNAEPGLADIAALLYKHLDASRHLLACANGRGEGAECVEAAAERAAKWVAEAPFVTASREVSERCPAS